MLYLSRVIGSPGKGDVDYNHTAPQLTRNPQSDMLFGVVDTDDGTEEIVTLKDIVHICCYLRITIAGVTVRQGMILSVKPWQSIMDRSTIQTKLLALSGIEINEYRGEISSICFDRLAIESKKDKVVIRLSDVSQHCGDFLFINIDDMCEKPVILKIDDNLSFTPFSFLGFDSYTPGTYGICVMFDLRELSHDNKAWLIYDMLFRLEKSSDPLDMIIDSAKRKARMKAEFLRLRH